MKRYWVFAGSDDALGGAHDEHWGFNALGAAIDHADDCVLGVINQKAYALNPFDWAHVWDAEVDRIVHTGTAESITA